MLMAADNSSAARSRNLAIQRTYDASWRRGETGGPIVTTPRFVNTPPGPPQQRPDSPAASQQQPLGSDSGGGPWQAAALVCVFGAVGAHALLATAADPFPTTDVVLQLLLLGVSLSLLLAALLAYFLLTARGPEVAAGLYAAYARRHRATYALAALAALALAGAGGYRASLTVGSGGGSSGGAVFGLGGEWRRPGYYALWLFARSALLAFHCTAAAGAAASLVPPVQRPSATAAFSAAAADLII